MQNISTLFLIMANYKMELEWSKFVFIWLKHEFIFTFIFIYHFYFYLYIYLKVGALFADL